MRLDRLLTDLYSCPTHPSNWPQFLDGLCLETDATSAVVQEVHFGAERGCPRWQATDHLTARRPIAGLASVPNPRLDIHRGLRGLNRVVTDDELFDRGDPARTRFQAELAKVGFGRFLGTLQQLEGDTFVAIALHRAIGDDRCFSAAQVQALAAFAPHVRQAFDLSSRLQAAQRRLEDLQAHMESLRFGVMICNRAGRLQWLNFTARQMAQAAVGWQLRDGAICAEHPIQNKRLRAAIAEVGPVPRYVAVGDGSTGHHIALRATERAHGDSEVLIAVTSPRAVPDVPACTWCDLLGLTRAEAALVSTLVRGGTVEQHSSEKGITVGTARIHLKQVMSKTGVHRQTDLVRLALGSAAMHLVDTLAA